MQTASQVKATPSVTHATLAKLRPPAIHTPTVAAAEASTIDTQQENVTRLGHSFGSISIFPPDARSIQLKPVVASAPRLPAFSPPSQHRPNPIPVIPAGWAVSPRVQAKLTVGQPNNVYEQAADRVTEQVVQRLAKTDAEKEKLDRKEEHTETLPEWQKSHVSSVGADGGLQMKCAACEAEEERGHVQKSPIIQRG